MALKSPFRYPGSKAKMRTEILDASGDVSTVTDVFVGGGSAALAYVDAGCRNLTLNDADSWIASFWAMCASGEVGGLLERIRHTKPSVDEFNRLRALEPESVSDKAFYGIYFNRTTYSGILRSGPIGGYEQKSTYKIDCRFNPSRLCEQISRITDAFSLINVSVHNLDYRDAPLNGLVFLDPPYIVAGKDLYREAMDNHEFFAWLTDLEERWLLTIDNHEMVREYLGDRDSSEVGVRYSLVGAWESKKELLLSSDSRDKLSLF